MTNGVTRDEFNRLDKQVNGNGQPGIKQSLEKIQEDQAAIRGAQDERAKVDNRRWKAMSLILALLTLLIGLVTLMEGNKQLHGNFSLHESLTAVSSMQHSQIPPLTR